MEIQLVVESVCGDEALELRSEFAGHKGNESVQVCVFVKPPSSTKRTTRSYFAPRRVDISECCLLKQTEVVGTAHIISPMKAKQPPPPPFEIKCTTNPNYCSKAFAKYVMESVVN